MTQRCGLVLACGQYVVHTDQRKEVLPLWMAWMMARGWFPGWFPAVNELALPWGLAASPFCAA